MDHYPDYCFVLSHKGEIIDLNKTAIKYSNKDKAWFSNQLFDSLIDEADLANFRNAFDSCCKSSDESMVECKVNLTPEHRVDGRIFISKNITPSSKRSSDSFLIIMKDITEEKKRETDLLRFFFVAENTVNPLQITDTEGRMIYVNSAFEKVSGYSSKELIGNNPSVFGSKKHPTKFWANMWTTISAGKPWIGEVENKKKDGEAFFTNVLISPIIDNEKKVIGYFGIHRDLTEKRNLEKQLIHTQKMESIGTLAAGVAHEVGNPLASISALVQIIQRQTKDDFIREKLELVKKQITRISKIIRDLVDFSRPSNYELRLTDINENIRESIEIVKVGKKAKDVDFTLDLEDGLLQTHLVADQIQQVFVNILINAVDAINEKRNNSKEPQKGAIKAFSRLDDSTYTIIFEDNGIGIKPEHAAKVFEPFFTTKTEGKGTGLGLWVSYGIVKSFQGELKIESSAGEWTRFIITLPSNQAY